MRTLVISVTPPLPANNGHRMRNWSILRALAAEGHQIQLVALARSDEEADVDQVRQLCREVSVVRLPWKGMTETGGYAGRLCALPLPTPYGVRRFRSGRLRLQVEALLANARFDAVLVETPYALASFESGLGCPFILDCHNLEHVLLERYAALEGNPLKAAYARIEAAKMRRWEKHCCAQAAAVWTCSATDRRGLEEAFPGARASVVPNAIPVDQYRTESRGDGMTLMFVGGMDWHPNRDGVEYFAASILPRIRRAHTGVRFVVAGRSPSEDFRRRLETSHGVEFTGTVPDMRPQLARADVCVVPLRMGSGTRLKILEAAAMGIPVVSTRLGAEGLEFVEESEILLADSPEDFAAAAARLLGDAGKRKALGMAALRRVEANYSLAALRTAVRTALSGIAPIWKENGAAPMAVAG